MAEKVQVGEGKKTSQTPPASVGQYVPQVFMVPYYAPHPGFNNYSQNQQHPPVFGQMPGNMQPTPIPMPGMPSPMTMTAIPVPSASGGPSQTASVVLNRFPTSIRPQAPTKLAINQNTSNNEAQGTQEASQSFKISVHNQTNHNAQQMHIPRACWTYVEEEVLVNVYGEYTFGNRMRKMTKVTWEAIAERLFNTSRQQLPQVTMKTWMQCKDKWNNMVKKHKYHRLEYLRRLNSGDYRAIEREGVFEALERILNYEVNSGTNFGNGFDQEETGGELENDRVTMVTNRDDDHVIKPAKEILASPGGGDEEQRNEAENHEDVDPRPGNTPVQENAEENVFHDYDFQNKPNSKPTELSISRSPGQTLKRALEISDREDTLNIISPEVETIPENAPKRARISSQENPIDNNRLYELLLRQTELLEQSRTQHTELLQHLVVSEENTRRLVLQTIKDLSTILNRLIKSEK